MNRTVATFLPGLLAGLALVPVVCAQNCQVRSAYRLATGVNNSPSQDVHFDSGWHPGAPMQTMNTSANSNNIGCSTRITVATTADYGLLTAVGDGVGTNSQGNGVFLWIDQNGDTAIARFHDTMTITSASLPNGAPVQLRFTVDLAGGAVVNDPNPEVVFGAQLQPWISSWPAAAVQGQAGIATIDVTTAVGAIVPFEGALFLTLRARALAGGGPFTSTMAFNLRARSLVTVLTPGADYTTCSGRRYRLEAATVQNIGGGCGAGSPLLTGGVPVMGQTIALSLSNAPPNQAVLFGLSIGAPVATPFGSCTCMLDLGTASIFVGGITDPAGNWSTPVVVANSPALMGIQSNIQAAVMVPTGPMLGAAILSNALQFRPGI